MAKKISRNAKRTLSLIFHLVVLFVMVCLYEAGRGMFKKEVPKPPEAEKAAETKVSPKSGDGTFEKLMAEKKRKAEEKAKAEKAALEKKEEGSE